MAWCRGANHWCWTCSNPCAPRSTWWSSACSTPSLVPADFTQSDEDGCRLSKDARARFYQAWAAARQDWPDLHPGAPVD